MPQAKYLCRSCKTVFYDKPKPVTCPRCGAIYIDWVNYKLWEDVGRLYLEKRETVSRQPEKVVDHSTPNR